MEDEERNLYYLGLPSQPKLVARSSSTPWVPRPYDWGYYEKLLRPVGVHPIVSKWNDDDTPTALRGQVIGVLARHKVNWHAIDVLRIGYEDDRGVLPVVLFISVEPASLTSELGFVVASQCKNILAYFDLPDVECEIKESRLVNLAPSPPRNILQLRSDARHRPYLEDCNLLSDCSGTSIAAADRPWIEGTRCLYLREVGTDAIFALTCRHVCFADHETGELITTTSCPPPPSSSRLAKSIIQPGNKTHGSVLERLQQNERLYLQVLEAFEERAGMMDEDRRLRRIQETQALLAGVKPVLEDFQNRKTPDKRVFGHVAYVREYGLRDHGEFSDWCLIRLDPNCFQRLLSELENRVVLGKVSLKDRFGSLQPSFMFKDLDVARVDDDGTIKLQGVVPVADFATLLSTGLESAMVLGKQGRTSSLTFGLLNQVKSVVRRPRPGYPSIIAVEWCIVPKNESYKKETRFTYSGDSGACIWDLSGRVVGMVTSGIRKDEMLQGTDHYGLDEAVDVTYFSPMEWILEDFKKCGLNINLL